MTSFLSRSPVCSEQPASLADHVHRSAIACGTGYAASVLGFAVLRRVLGPRNGWIELIDDMEPWAYLPAPLLTLSGIAVRSRGLTGAGAALAAMFGLRWGLRYLRKPPAPTQTASDLTFMTFNTLAWERDCDDLADSILAARPDVVGLQEIGPKGANYLAATLRERYPHQYLMPSPDSSGAAVFSRYPLRDTVSFRASTMGHWWQRMIVDTPGGPVTYLNLHTKIPHIRTTRRLGRIRFPKAFHADRRRREVSWLCAMLARTDGPVVIGGDFNMTERSQDYKMLAQHFQDSYRAVGVGLGHTFPKRGSFPRAFPMPWPMLRLDYLWHSDHFATAWAYRGDAGRSDHHPVVAGLRWRIPTRQSVDERSLPLAASAV